MAQVFYVEKGINWFRISSELPDMNPIENVLHKLKEFISHEVKPTTKDQLVEGIQQLWSTVDVAKCCRYIRHLRKVFLK